MASFELCKTFCFSASYERGTKLYANNFNITVCAQNATEDSERRITAFVQDRFISKVHTSHLNNVHFFSQTKEINEFEILRTFWFELSIFLKEFDICKVILKKDDQTAVAFYPDKLK